jgi:hypothetical protein
LPYNYFLKIISSIKITIQKEKFMGLILTSNNNYEWFENEIFQSEEIPKTIEDYTKDLANTDYKVLKCIEYSMVNNELPYDIAALHQQRQAIRDIINEMEADYGTNQ